MTGRLLNPWNTPAQRPPARPRVEIEELVANRTQALVILLDAARQAVTSQEMEAVGWKARQIAAALVRELDAMLEPGNDARFLRGRS